MPDTPTEKIVYVERKKRKDMGCCSSLIITAFLFWGIMWIAFRMSTPAHPTPAVALAEVPKESPVSTPQFVAIPKPTATPIPTSSPTPWPKTQTEIDQAIRAACEQQDPVLLSQLISQADRAEMTTTIAELHKNGWFHWLDIKQHPQAYAPATPLQTQVAAFETPEIVATIDVGNTILNSYIGNGFATRIENPFGRQWKVYLNPVRWAEKSEEGHEKNLNQIVYGISKKVGSESFDAYFYLDGDTHEIASYGMWGGLKMNQN